jgi:hypothetical protein
MDPLLILILYSSITLYLAVFFRMETFTPLPQTSTALHQDFRRAHSSMDVHFYFDAEHGPTAF